MCRDDPKENGGHIKVAQSSLGEGYQKHKPGVQSWPGFVLVSDLGFPLGQSYFA